MPDKEKSVKTVPKSNGNDAIDTEPSTTDVIATDVKKGASNKKREKHKNKEAIKVINNASENGLNSTTSTDSDICAVSEELLKRLQCNGISVRRSDGTLATEQPNSGKHGDNNGLKTVSSDKSKPSPSQKSKQLNNNNNNSKAHNKNCQNQSKTTAKNVNNNLNNVEISADGAQTVQCNGTHANQSMPSCTGNHEVSTDHHHYHHHHHHHHCHEMGSTEQTEAAKTSKEISSETPSCSSQHYNNQPSTSTSIPNECTLPSLPRTALSVKSIKSGTIEVTFKEYENELQMPDIMRVIQRELSEPYSIYTYRYFIHNWPKLCFLAMDGDNCIGAIVCKLDIHRQMTKRGYIAMLAVDAAYRKLKVGTTLVQKAIEVCFGSLGRFKFFFQYHRHFLI